MQTIFVFTKCELSEAYEVTDEAILNVESGIWSTFNFWSV